MSTNFPAALDNGTSLPNPATTDKRNSPSHAGLHDNENGGIIAAQTKIGTGASTPVANTLLFGTGTGTTAWQGLTSAQLLAILSDETGTGVAVFNNTPTLITPKVDTINENTLNNGVTVGGVSLKAGVVSTNSAIPTATLQDSSVTSAKVATGFVVQIVSTNFSAVATGTTVIPTDDTIPQNTEGDQYMTQAITPKSTTNRLSIELTAVLSNSSAAADMIMALFQDSTAGALAATLQTFPTTTYQQNITLRHDMAAGTTSATTFKMRGGGSSAGTTTFNGQGAARKFGGITISNIRIIEYKA